MIPKIIHYCWLSGEEYPELYKNCINTWKLLDGYEFVLWDYAKCKDIIENVPFVKRAYESKAYAYVADYIRLYAIYNYGGIYLDCDVQIIKPFDDLLHLPMLWCQENEEYVNAVECAVMGAEKGHDFIKYLLDYYTNYKDDKISVMPNVVGYNGTKYFKNGIKVIDKVEDYDVNDKDTFYRFTKDYFSPKSFVHNNMNVTANTYAIHYFNNGWKKSNGLYTGVFTNLGHGIKFNNLDDKINTIHIIWLGEKPVYDKYFDSIKTFVPDFEIKVWRDEDCMHYINECEYAKRHYANKNYAYVSDYVRFRILYEFGGMYIDTDVEFIRNFDDIINAGSFLAIEKQANRVASGLIMYFNHINNDCLYECIKYYNNSQESVIIDGDVLAYSLLKYGYKTGDFNQTLINNIKIYNSSYFNGTSKLNLNTRAIHHYTNFWKTW